MFPGRPYLGLVAVFAFALGIVGVAVSGAPGADTQEEFDHALDERGYGFALAATMFTAAGISVAVFFGWLASRFGMPDWTRPVASIWGGVWVLAGFLMFTVGEIGGHEEDPEGAALVASVVYLLMVNPIAAVLGGLLALGFAVGTAPRGMRRVSLLLGVLALAAASLGSIGGIGLLGLGPMVAWLLTVSLWAAATGGRPVAPQAPPA